MTQAITSPPPQVDEEHEHDRGGDDAGEDDVGLGDTDDGADHTAERRRRRRRRWHQRRRRRSRKSLMKGTEEVKGGQ